MIDASEVINLLNKAIADAGTQADWCRVHRISRSYVSDVVSGNAEPGKKILDALGYERIIMYRKITPDKSRA